MDELTRLLIEARDGNSASLATFVRKTQPEIWRFCAHFVGCGEADDATQETYLAAWRALPMYRGEASARTWLFVITRRTAARVARRRQRWRQLADGAPRPAPRGGPGALTEFEGALTELDADRRLALLLTQVMGLTYGEAAEVCECSIGTIRSRVARARAELLARRQVNDADTLRGS